MPGTALKNQTTGKVVYTPPEGQDRLRDLLANWERFLHDDSDLDPLIRMAVGHYQFEAIHPFTDGNGRTGRILNLLFLVEQGLLDQPVLYLSRAIIRRRTEYYRLLNAVTRDDAWEPWVPCSTVHDTAGGRRRRSRRFANCCDATAHAGACAAVPRRAGGAGIRAALTAVSVMSLMPSLSGRPHRCI